MAEAEVQAMVWVKVLVSVIGMVTAMVIAMVVIKIPSTVPVTAVPFTVIIRVTVKVTVTATVTVTPVAEVTIALTLAVKRAVLPGLRLLPSHHATAMPPCYYHAHYHEPIKPRHTAFVQAVPSVNIFSVYVPCMPYRTAWTEGGGGAESRG